MKIDKKVHLNKINFILGTKCNLNCRHCAGGKPEHMSISEKTIDDFFENVNGISSLVFIGYEISLHKKEIKMIFDKIIDKNILVNDVGFLTNAVIYDDELVKMFNDFRFNHTTHPLDSVFQFSDDKFHFNNGFNKDTLYRNIERYKQEVGKCNYFIEYGDSIVWAGKAKNLEANDLNDIKEINIMNEMKCPEFRPTCSGSSRCPGSKNCIVDGICLTPNGYVFVGNMFALTSIADNDYSKALGNVSQTSIYDMIQKYIKEKSNKTQIEALSFRDYNSLFWCNSYLLHKYLSLREELIESIYSNQRYMFEFSKSKYSSLEKEMDKILKDFNLNMGIIYDNSPNVDKVKKRAMLTIILIIKDIKELFDIGTRFFIADTQKQSEIQTELRKREEISSFNEKEFYRVFQYDYKLFKELWDSYESYDIERYAELYRKMFGINGGDVI